MYDDYNNGVCVCVCVQMDVNINIFVDIAGLLSHLGSYNVCSTFV